MESNEAPQTRFVPIFGDPSIPALACGLDGPKVLAASRKNTSRFPVNAGRALAPNTAKRYGSLYSVPANGEVSVVRPLLTTGLEFPTRHRQRRACRHFATTLPGCWQPFGSPKT